MTTEPVSQAEPLPPEEIARMFDARAADYDGSAFHMALAREVVQFAWTERVGSVLDIATGTGLVLRALPRYSIRMAGVDLSPGMLRVARRNLPGAELLVADAAEPLPFADGSFDLITCVTALHLMPSPSDALRSWRRLLSPAGRIVVAALRTDNCFDVPKVAAARARGAVRRPHGEHHLLHERIGTPAALAAVAVDAGYRVSRQHTWVMRDPLEVCQLVELAAMPAP